MYTPVCKDVFNGGRDKAIDSLKEYKFNRELQEFWTSVVNLGADLAWMLVALAKRSEGEAELDETIDSNWKLITEQWVKYDTAAEQIVEKHHDYFFHEDSILMGAKYFIDKCIDNRDKESVWQAKGFTVFMSMLVITGLDFHIWLMDDADENFANIRPMYPSMVERVNELTGKEYEVLTQYRVDLAQTMEVVSSKRITFSEFFKQDSNIKDFRNKLGAFISLDILRRQQTGGLTELLKVLGGLKLLDGRAQKGGSTHMPDDIDGIEFDD